MDNLEELARIVVDCGYQVHCDFGPGLIELKSTERHEPVHAKRLLTYLRLMELPLGFLINFGAPTYKEGVRRLTNQYFRPID